MIIPPFQPLNTQVTDSNNNEEFSLDDYSEFAQGILSAIPDSDRPTVAKYVKQWDGNVTKQFQKIHEDYKPYKELGDLEDVQTAMYYTSMLQNDPIAYVKTIIQACEEAGMPIDDLFPSQGGDDNEGGGIDPSTGIPKEVQNELTQLRNMVSTMYGQFQQDLTTRQEQQQLDEFDRFLKSMHSTHGEFDDDWVSLQIERGVDPEKAIGMFKENFPGYGSQNRRPAPTLISGNGTIRRDQVNPGKMSTAERKDYVGQILRANLSDD